MSWSPNPNQLEQIVVLLGYVQQGDNKKQREIQEMFQQLKRGLSDFGYYLAYVFSQHQVKIETKVLAGLLLKDYLRTMAESSAALPAELWEFVKNQSLQMLVADQRSLFLAAGSLVNTIVGIIGLEKWPNLLPDLMKLIDSNHYVESAVSALSKICEDHNKVFDPNTVVSIFAKLLKVMKSPSQGITANVIQCLNQFIISDENGVIDDSLLHQFMSTLSQCASNSNNSPEVKKAICQALVFLLEALKEKMLPTLPSVIGYILSVTNDPDPDVALEACEFWLAFAEIPTLIDYLSMYYDQLIPLLLEKMIYDPDDIACFDLGENAAIPDKNEDVKPRHVKSKASEEGEIPDEDDEDDLNDDDYDDMFGNWNIRKCSAATIDIISNKSKNKDLFLQILLPIINRNILHNDSMRVECGILALGAIAEGCYDQMEVHLLQLVGFLLNSLHHQQPLVRSITCWTMSRYSTWLVNTFGDENLRNQFFDPFVKRLLGLVLDKNKKVQESAIAALTTFIERAGVCIYAYVDNILGVIGEAFVKYQKKNRLILYETLANLCEICGDVISKSEKIGVFLPFLLKQWECLDYEQTELCAVLECITAFAAAVPEQILPVADPMLGKTLNMISRVLSQQQHNNDDAEYIDKEYVNLGFDILGGMAQGLQASLAPFLENHKALFLNLLMASLKDELDIRKCAFGVIGDLAQHCIGILIPQMDYIMNETLNNMMPANSRGFSASNNAIWSCGEICMSHGSNMEKYAVPLLMNLKQLLILPIQRSLRENVTVCIGRLGRACPTAVAPHLPSFIEPWCLALREVSHPYERETAFDGMCDLIVINPNGVMNSIPHILVAILSYREPSAVLDERFKRIVIGYRDMLGANWAKCVGILDATLQKELHGRYNI